MKQKDIALLMVIVIISSIVSFGLGHLLFASPKDRKQKVEVVDALSIDFQVPDATYFNGGSINPTRLIQITENANNAPFKGN